MIPVTRFDSKQNSLPQMHKRPVLPILLISCIALFNGCHKKRDNTLAIHLKVISATTGLAVPSKVTLEYEKTGADYAETHHEELGDTDQVEWKSGRM